MRDHEKSNAYIKQKFKGKIVDIAIFLDGKKTRKLLVLEFPTKLKSLHMLSISQLCGCQKGGNTYRYGSRCGSVETCCKAAAPIAVPRENASRGGGAVRAGKDGRTVFGKCEEDLSRNERSQEVQKEARERRGEKDPAPGDQ